MYMYMYIYTYINCMLLRAAARRALRDGPLPRKKLKV